MDIVFSPVRNPGESWTERLQWLLMTDGFGFNNPLSREEAGLALDLMAEYTGEGNGGLSYHENHLELRQRWNAVMSTDNVHPIVACPFAYEKIIRTVNFNTLPESRKTFKKEWSAVKKSRLLHQGGKCIIEQYNYWFIIIITDPHSHRGTYGSGLPTSQSKEIFNVISLVKQHSDEKYGCFSGVFRRFSFCHYSGQWRRSRL